jgi:hypothetical protein
MPMPDLLLQDPAYRRLRSSLIPLVGSSSYWLAEDHLLVVDVFGLVERYRKFRLEDIEHIVIRPNRLRLILGLILGSLLIPFLGMAIGFWIAGLTAIDGEGEGWIVAAVFVSVVAAILIPILAFVLIGGTMCEVRMTTAVQEIRLPGLYRLPKARALVQELQATTQRLTPTSTASPVP